MPITMRITHLMIISNTIVITYTSSSGSSKNRHLQLATLFLGVVWGAFASFHLATDDMSSTPALYLRLCSGFSSQLGHLRSEANRATKVYRGETLCACKVASGDVGIFEDSARKLRVAEGGDDVRTRKVGSCERCTPKVDRVGKHRIFEGGAVK